MSTFAVTNFRSNHKLKPSLTFKINETPHQVLRFKDKKIFVNVLASDLVNSGRFALFDLKVIQKGVLFGQAVRKFTNSQLKWLRKITGKILTNMCAYVWKMVKIVP